jgi:hypothetical protein
MIGLVESALLFTRGSESVRLVRMTRADGPSLLFVHGPGHLQTTHVLEDTIECLWCQSDVERQLQKDGFQLVPLTSADRRSGHERRHHTRGADRRREMVADPDAEARNAARG